VPPDDDRNAIVITLPSQAALKVAIRLKLGFFTIVGVPIKSGLAASAVVINVLEKLTNF
jgi:hypothetical protein